MSNIVKMLRYHSMEIHPILRIGFGSVPEYLLESPQLFVISLLPQAACVIPQNVTHYACTFLSKTSGQVKEIHIATNPSLSREKLILDTAFNEKNPELRTKAFVISQSFSEFLDASCIDPTFFKGWSLDIDANGGEYDILESMLKHLHQFETVFSRTYHSSPYRDGKDCKQLRALIEPQGFRPRHIFMAPGAHNSIWFRKGANR